MKKINLKAYAKLNLFLDILKKREDGYHEILTAIHMVDLADDVEINVSSGKSINITCSSPALPTDVKNTAYKAAELFLIKLGKQAQVDIIINKKIPVMAGLGGSSTDAAAVLRGLNKLAGEPFSFDELLELGAEIGSDVPFCIHGGYAFCTGTGATISKALPELNGAFLIIKPPFSCSTQEAYTLYAINPPAECKKNDLFLYNVFEVLYNNPEINKIKQELIRAGALGACLTGSGSAVFGLFESYKKAEKAYAVLNNYEKYIARPVKRLEN